MKLFALACDYDGTLATDGLIARSTMAALQRLRTTGRKLILVTGRTMADLSRVCPELEGFERLIAENGAVIHSPADRRTRTLCPRLPERFINELRARGVAPLSLGEVLAATDKINATKVTRTIQDLGLELQLEFNKGALMVLPPGVNKGTGLRAALDEMGLLPHVVGIGDAENDRAFLQLCECSAAVANALPSLKDIVDLVTQGSNWGGVAELIERVLYDELVSIRPDRARRSRLGWPAAPLVLLRVWAASAEAAIRPLLRFIDRDAFRHELRSWWDRLVRDGDYRPVVRCNGHRDFQFVLPEE